MLDTRIKIDLMATPPRKARKPRRKARHSRNNEGSLHLIPLPLGLGLYYGKGFGCWRVRSWEWARYDFADYEPHGSERWADIQLSKHPEAAHPIAAAWEKYQSKRFTNQNFRRIRKAKANCVTCGKDSKQYADIGRAGYECAECYESGIEA